MFRLLFRLFSWTTFLFEKRHKLFSNKKGSIKIHISSLVPNFKSQLEFHGRFARMAAKYVCEPDELNSRKRGAIGIDAPLKNYSNLAAEAGTALLDLIHWS